MQTTSKSEKLTRDGVYPLADRLTYREATNLFRLYGPRVNSRDLIGGRDGWIRKHVRAMWSGEKRPPRKGEWYLSGSEIEAYRAPNDLTTAYHIAKIVRIEEVVRIVQHDITLDDGPTVGDAFHD